MTTALVNGRILADDGIVNRRAVLIDGAHVPGALVRSLSMSAEDGAELRRLLKELLTNLDAAE